MRAGVIDNTLVRPRKQVKVIRLAGMFNPKRLSEQGALLGKTVDEGGGRRTDDRREGVVLFDYDHHMVGRYDAKNVGLRDGQGHVGGMSNTATGGSHGHIRSSGDR